MAVSVTINGSSYSFPATGDENWGDPVTQWAQAVSLHLLQKTGGTFTLSNDINFGASFGLKSLYYTSLAANVSNTGAIRLGNSEGYGWRNFANTADLLITVDSSDILNFGGTPIAFPVALGAANTVQTSNGTIPVWKLLDNANVDAAAAIARTKIASGSNDHVLINDASGVLSSEAALSPVRGGSGVANNAAATLTRSGNFALTFTTTATTSLTLPTAGTLATTTLSVVNKTTTYLATAADNVITADATAGAFTITLPAAASNSGKVLRFKKTDSTFSAVTIDGNLSETIDGATTTTLNTLNETLSIISDGTNWQILERKSNTPWVAYTPTLNSNTGVATNASFWRRLGDSIQLAGSIVYNNTGGASNLSVAFPTGVPAVDTAKFPGAATYSALGFWGWFDSVGSVASRGGFIYLQGGTVLNFIRSDNSSNAASTLFAASDEVTWNVTAPITGWKA